MEKKQNIGIGNDDIKNIKSIIKKNDRVDGIIIFGSRAKGNYKPGSDIDIALKGEELVLNDILDIKNELDDLFLPYTFDIVIYSRIKEQKLLEHINRVGINL